MSAASWRAAPSEPCSPLRTEDPSLNFEALRSFLGPFQGPTRPGPRSAWPNRRGFRVFRPGPSPTAGGRLGETPRRAGQGAAHSGCRPCMLHTANCGQAGRVRPRLAGSGYAAYAGEPSCLRHGPGPGPPPARIVRLPCRPGKTAAGPHNSSLAYELLRRACSAPLAVGGPGRPAGAREGAERVSSRPAPCPQGLGCQCDSLLTRTPAGLRGKRVIAAKRRGAAAVTVPRLLGAEPAWPAGPIMISESDSARARPAAPTEHGCRD